MDNLFRTRILTQAVNEIRTGETRIYDKFFRGKENMQSSERLAFDIITGNETILENLNKYAEAPIGTKTTRRTVTLEAPRLAEKRLINAGELNALRAYGVMGAEMLKDRLAREQLDMKAKFDRTLEYWACGALRGVVYDADAATILYDFGVAGTHKITLSTGWDDSSGDPIGDIRAWKQLIEDDSMTTITGWQAYCGATAMDALLANESVLNLMKQQFGVQIATSGTIGNLAGVAIEEYNGSYFNSSGVRTRFVGAEQVILIGMCTDLTDMPFAPIMDLNAPNGVGNVGAGGRGMMFYSSSHDSWDPSGKWIKTEARPLPVLKRPGAVIIADVVT
jgi:hypothetical protein